MPDTWASALGETFRGRVQLLRRFGRPGQLDRHESLWLVLRGIDPGADVYLNDHHLGRTGGYALEDAFNVTALLEPRNKLRLECELPDWDLPRMRAVRPLREQAAGGIVGEVSLEVRFRHALENLGCAVLQRHEELWLEIAGRLSSDTTRADEDDHLELVVGGSVLEEGAAPDAPAALSGSATLSDSAAPERTASPDKTASPDSAAMRNEPLAREAAAGPHYPTQREWLHKRLTHHEAFHELIRLDGPWPEASDLPVSVSPTAQMTTAGRPTTPRAPLLVEIRLLCNGVTCWSTTVGTEPVETLPPDVSTVGDLARATEGEVLYLDRIGEPREYEQLRRRGVRVVQAVPMIWADELTARLAQHRAIVAWSPVGEVPSSSHGPSPRQAWGRPWLSADETRS
jgi:hypothetical protein